MTGTPLDLLNLGGLLQGIGLLYWVVAAVLLFLAVRRPKTRQRKIVWAAIVVAIFGWTPAKTLWQTYVSRSNLSAAMKHFEQRCKSAGEKITRTVENVDGVVWMKWRDKQMNESDQFKMDDPFGHDCSAEGCIEQLLRITEGLDLDSKREQRRQFGYRYVESKDPKDERLRRYTLRLYRTHDRDKSYSPDDVSSEFGAQAIEQPSARYGITWDDISTWEDREKWVAGGSIKVIDLQTNEVIAERVGYMIDRGQGSWSNGPTPWGMALHNACPPFPPVGPGDRRVTRSWPNTETLTFVSKVLQPSKAN